MKVARQIGPDGGGIRPGRTDAEQNRVGPPT
jgi:hypothetical protein